MDAQVRKVRLRRFMRQSCHVYWRELIGPFWDRAQLLALIQAIFATYLIIQTATFADIVAEISSWWIAIQAFGLVLLVWAAICVVRAPLLARKEEAERGHWYNNRFTYRQPELVATIRCKATGQPQFHRFIFDSAEARAFVDCHIDAEGDPPAETFTASVVGDVVLKSMMTEPGRGVIDSSLRIGEDKSAELLVVAEGNMSRTFRIYIHGFRLGESFEQDGEEGEFREPFRRAG